MASKHLTVRWGPIGESMKQTGMKTIRLSQVAVFERKAVGRFINLLAEEKESPRGHHKGGARARRARNSWEDAQRKGKAGRLNYLADQSKPKVKRSKKGKTWERSLPLDRRLGQSRKGRGF